MRKIVLLFVFLSVFIVNAQEKVIFPESFNLDLKLLNGLVIAKIPDELQERGIIENPAVTENKDAIRYMTEFNSEDVLQVYYQIYQDEKDESDDAGVIVSRFISEEALRNNLRELRDQSNLAYLIKDNYLIEVWSDVSQDSTEQIAQMVDYYQNKLQAELYEAPEYPSQSTSVADESEGQ